MSDILSPIAINSSSSSLENAPTLEFLAEQVLVQSLISFPTQIEEFSITLDFFLEPFFRNAFEIVNSMYLRKAPISLDLIKLSNAEKFSDESFVSFFAELWKYRDKTLNKNLKYYLDILKERHFKNSFDKLRMFPPQGETLTVTVEKFISTAQELVIANTDVMSITFNQDWANVLEIATDAESGIFPHALKSHYKALDNLLGEGILDDYLMILGADSGAGKTTFALNLIRNVAIHDKHATLYLSFEMGRTRLMRWFMSACTGIPMASFIEGTLTPKQWTDVTEIRAKQLCPDALVIVETFPELSNVVRTIRTHVKANPNIRMIVIDHLHRMLWNKSSNSTEIITAITGALKDLAINLNVPIVLLSQLKKPDAPLAVRGVVAERRDPHVSDLKGSGSIISDADLIMMLQIDPSTKLGDNLRFVRAYILKNRGGNADSGAWVGLAHQADRCVMICN